MRSIALSLALSLALLPACKTLKSAEGAAAEVLLPVDQEKQLGLQLQPEIEKDVKLSTDPAVVDYVKGLGQKVAAAAPNADRWDFTFKVIDDPKTVNAFAIPGGSIYVYTGLLKAAKDESEVVGVLAHEVAHVTQRHIARRMVEAMGLQTVAGLALGQNPGMVSQIAAAMVVQGTLLKNSRDDEAEADAKGVVFASKAGWDPMGMVDFFRTLKKSEGQTPALLTFLSDHPATGDRIDSIEAQIREEGLSGGKRNPEALKAVQARIGEP